MTGCCTERLGPLFYTRHRIETPYSADCIGNPWLASTNPEAADLFGNDLFGAGLSGFLRPDHFLGHEEKQSAIAFIGPAQQMTELRQESRVLA